MCNVYIFHPIRTYGIPLCGTASNSNTEILQWFQNKVLRVLVNVPWCVPNEFIHSDLNVLTVREATLSVDYRGRLQARPSHLVKVLFEDEE